MSNSLFPTLATVSRTINFIRKRGLLLLSVISLTKIGLSWYVAHFVPYWTIMSWTRGPTTLRPFDRPLSLSRIVHFHLDHKNCFFEYLTEVKLTGGNLKRTLMVFYLWGLHLFLWPIWIFHFWQNRVEFWVVQWLWQIGSKVLIFLPIQPGIRRANQIN